jgi:hypothetical protein
MSQVVPLKMPHDAVGFDLGDLAIEFRADKMVLIRKSLGDHYTIQLGAPSGVLDVHRTWKDELGREQHKTVFAMHRAEGNDNRRNADVIVAFEYRRYYKFKASYDESHATGMCFFASDGTRIANYPKQHSENLTAKHHATGNKFKPLVRIFKNMRSKLIDDGLIAEGSAPSYYIEGLLYNVPNDKFVGDYQDIFLNILKWLYETKDRTEFVCANEQYYLLRDNSHTCWACADGEKFINGAIKLWNEW